MDEDDEGEEMPALPDHGYVEKLLTTIVGIAKLDAPMKGVGTARETATQLLKSCGGPDLIKWWIEGPTGQSFILAKRKAEKKAAKEKMQNYREKLSKLQRAYKRGAEIAGQWLQKADHYKPANEDNESEVFALLKELALPNKNVSFVCEERGE